MFLLGVEFVIASYVGVRLYEHRAKKTTQPAQIDLPIDNHPNESQSLKLKEVIETGEREKNLHYLKVSGATLGFALLSNVNPLFLAPTLLLFTYSAFPYLREIEHSLVQKKKIDGYVLYGIADFMTLGLGRVATASFAVSLVHISHYIISNAERNSKQGLVNIFEKQPNTVWLLREGIEVEVSLEQVVKGDIVVVNTGDIIPVDGTVIQGIATVDQHVLTGESQPAEKAEGDMVFASTQLMTGCIHIKTLTSGEDTTVSKITQMLNHSIDFKTNTQMRGEQWADQWNLPVLGLAFASMPLLGPVGTIVILNGHIAQNIRIVAPLSTLNHLTVASHKGILVKDGRVLEDLHAIDTFLFDKTGTLTSEEPEVGRITSYHDNYTYQQILTYAAAAERKLKHPIARAILNRASLENIELPEIDDSDYKIGYGISVLIDNKHIRVGSRRFMEAEQITLPTHLDQEMQHAHDAGHSLVMVAIDHDFAGVLELRAAVRPEVVELLADLRKRGAKHLAIVSGDHRQPTQRLAEKLGMDDYFSDVLPQNKAEIVEKLQAEGRSVCFIGDGVNDTIAMKKANISISLSGATSVATDTAQIVLMDGSLSRLPDLLDISLELDDNLNRGWMFNIVPGTLTVLSAFLLHNNIIGAMLINQGGLGLGVINSMLPLQQVEEKKTNNIHN